MNSHFAFFSRTVRDIDLIGTVKERIFTGTPISGYILPGTQVNFYWEKTLRKKNWLEQKFGSKVDWDTILRRKIGWNKILWRKTTGITIWVKYSAGTICSTKLDWDAIFLGNWVGQWAWKLTEIFWSTWVTGISF